MKIEKFEDIIAWQKSKKLTVDIYRILKNNPMRKQLLLTVKVLTSFHGFVIFKSLKTPVLTLLGMAGFCL